MQSSETQCVEHDTNINMVKTLIATLKTDGILIKSILYYKICCFWKSAVTVPFPSTADWGVFMLFFLRQTHRLGSVCFLLTLCLLVWPLWNSIIFCGWRMGVVLPSQFLKVLKWGIVKLQDGIWQWGRAKTSFKPGRALHCNLEIFLKNKTHTEVAAAWTNIEKKRENFLSQLCMGNLTPQSSAKQNKTGRTFREEMSSLVLSVNTEEKNRWSFDPYLQLLMFASTLSAGQLTVLFKHEANTYCIITLIWIQHKTLLHVGDTSKIQDRFVCQKYGGSAWFGREALDPFSFTLNAFLLTYQPSPEGLLSGLIEMEQSHLHQRECRIFTERWWHRKMCRNTFLKKLSDFHALCTKWTDCDDLMYGTQLKWNPLATDFLGYPRVRWVRLRPLACFCAYCEATASYRLA